MLKLTARILFGLMTVALGLAVAWADPGPRDPSAPFDRASAGQPMPGSSDDRQRQADDLLQRARAAMAANDLDAANQLIMQADALDVPYSPLHLGDTPRKLRHELEKRYQMAGRAAPPDPFIPRAADPLAAVPSDPKSTAKSHLLNGRKELARRNFDGAAFWCARAAEQRASFGPNEDSPERLADDIRRMGGSIGNMASPQAGPYPRSVPSPVSRLPSIPDARQPMAGLGPDPLLEARQALAVGDVRRASQKVQQARALGIRYNPTDDNPEKVEAAIVVYGDLAAQKAERGASEAWRRQYAKCLMDQADALLRWRDYNEAERLATEAARQRINYSPYELRPEMVLDQVAAARRQSRAPTAMPSAAPRNDFGVLPAAGEFVAPATGSDFDHRASSAVYDPATDRTQNVLARDQQPAPPAATGQPMTAMAWFQQGENALRAHDTRAATECFRQAYLRVQELDPVTARRLQDHLQMLAAAGAGANRVPPVRTGMTDEVAAKQQLAARQLAAEVGTQERAAEKLAMSDPKAAIAALEQTRAKVQAATIDQAPKDLLLRRIDRSLGEIRQYAQENRSRIENDQQNKKVRQEIDREKQAKLEIQTKIAEKIKEFNTMMHERRFEEAEVVAKQALELDPQDAVAQQCVTEAKLIRNLAAAMAIREKKEAGFIAALESVDETSIPFDDRLPYIHGDAKTWKALSEKRQKYAKEQGRKMSERELEIQQKLKTPVSVQFENTPLAKVIDHLGQLAGVNFYMDPQGLAEQGVSTDTPVTIDLRHEIKLESALNLILQPLRLSYVTKDEVLKITSEQYKNVQVYTRTYNVADLVIPIPNFVPHNGLGLDGAYRGAMASVNFGGAGPYGASNASPLAVVASRDGRSSSGAIDPTILAQMSGGSKGATPASTPAGGPGNLGGASMADFDSLIDLITTTVQPTTWDAVGGPGSIYPFETNLSLVISQTQEVHEEVVDLLEQLRRLQDLQVTIEVRFITLNDNFFERIGVDFNFKVNDNTGGRVFPGFANLLSYGVGPNGSGPIYNTPTTGYRELEKDHSMTIGLAGPGVGHFSSDLDIPFTQDSFTLAVPQFGGFNPGAGASIGFAILSEIEAYFFIQAAQGDQRTNVLQAPKVTLFNGQMAFVSDTSQSPFVISVIPVVGDFAAAQQPVIIVLSEGTFLTVQAVVSNDRRFVRLTVVPFFSTIGNVETFTFAGSETTTNTSSQQGVQDQPNDNTKKRNRSTTTKQGTTVQLPTFAFVTVTTTVSVPDGGTVLLGGIKRLSEGRSEFGVPILAQIPYINRLFKNVGIGRETSSLMMMVTPRIIIQEEEEERLGIQMPGP